MVDFRYHVVSIIAVFLALATGILFGTTALNGPVLRDLESRVDRLSGEKDDLRGERDALERALQQDEQFVTALTPVLVDDALRGHRVVVISAPQVGKDVREAVSAVLAAGGATVTAGVRLQPKVSDPRSAGEVDDLVARLVPAGTDVGAPTTAERFAAVLAAVLTTEAATVPTAPAASAVSALTGFEDAGLVDVEGGRTPVEADLAVLLLPVPENDPDDAAKAVFAQTSATLLALVDALSAEARVTLAASPRGGAVDGSALQSLRGDSRRAARAASVDYVDAPSGQVATVLALAEALRGETGHYGTGSGVDALVPQTAAS